VVKREVREKLLTKLAISHQGLSKRARRLKEKYGPMTTDEAVYIIAHLEGLDLSRYLPLQSLERIRSMIPRETKNREFDREASPKAKPKQKKRNKISYPLVTSSFIHKVNAIAEDEFPKVFILENSIRSLIRLKLSAVQNDWWPKLIPGQVLENVGRLLKKELKYPHREKRGKELLMYCNFDDLKKIIIDETNFPHFQNVIIDSGWFRVKMEEVYMARNNLAHSILLSKDDIATINVFFNQWARLLESAGIK
jgi:hypothetical protein